MKDFSLPDINEKALRFLPSWHTFRLVMAFRRFDFIFTNEEQAFYSFPLVFYHFRNRDLLSRKRYIQ